MKREIPTKKMVTENVEHCFCNKCGEEMNKPDNVHNEGNGIEVRLVLSLKFINFDLCLKCIYELMSSFVIPAEEIDREEY